MKKNVVVGLGEIGYPILKLLSKKQPTVGYDINKGLMNNSKFKTLLNTPTSFLHVAIPVTSKFDSYCRVRLPRHLAWRLRLALAQ